MCTCIWLFQVELFDGGAFSGRHVITDHDNADLASLKFNKKTSSAVIHGKSHNESTAFAHRTVPDVSLKLLIFHMSQLHYIAYSFLRKELPYLLEYKSHSCISRTLTLELKIGTKLFWGLFTFQVKVNTKFCVWTLCDNKSFSLTVVKT